MELKRTPFYEVAQKAGGRFVDFGGWELPVKYSSDKKEHLHVRSKVGVFDVSHMGEIIIKGKDALLQTNYLVTNDVSKLKNGEILYTPMMNKIGGVVDDLLVYKISDTHFMLVVNGANVEKDYEWMLNNNKYNTSIINQSADYAQLAIQGPDSEKVLSEIFDKSIIEDIIYYNFRSLTYKESDIILSRTGYTGEDGFEVYMPNIVAESFWNQLFKVGEKYDIKPIGLGARDTLRLEKKMALYGHELTENISPIEAGLKWTVKMDKNEFIGKDQLIEKKGKLKRKIVGIELIEKGVPRSGNKIFNSDNEEIGFVTSGTMSPSLKKPIALVMVNKKYSKKGIEFFISIHNKLKKAVVIKTPFL